jgi:anti-sigma regulatory factor (Ser/Thr protein kinase)
VHPSIVASAELLVSELAANAVRHTSGSSFEVRVCVDAEIDVAVHDAESSLPRPRRPRPWQPGGRGLLLVDEIADAWGTSVESDGKWVWFRLSLTPRPRIREQPSGPEASRED